MLINNNQSFLAAAICLLNTVCFLKHLSLWQSASRAWCVKLDGGCRAGGQGWGEDAPRGGLMLSGNTSCLPCPGSGRRGGFLSRVPGCLREMLQGAIGDHLLPPPVRAGDGMRAGTTGARRCLVPAQSQTRQDERMGNHLQPSGGKRPPLWGFDSGVCVCKGTKAVSRLGWYRWVLNCLMAFFLPPPCNGLISFCGLFFLHFLATRVPHPKKDQCQRLRSTHRQQLQEQASWTLLSIPTAHGRSQLRWPYQPALGCSAGAWAPEQGVPRSRCQSRLLADRLWLGRLSCCWPAHSDLLVLVTSSCFLIWIPVPPFCF